MSNAINNAAFRIMRETKNNWNGRPERPSQPCPRCAGTMYLSPTPDGRMGILECNRCRMRQMVRMM